MIDYEDIDVVAGRFQLEAKLIAERLENRRPIVAFRIDAQILGNPLHFPVEFRPQAGVIDHRAIKIRAGEAPLHLPPVE